MLKLFSVRSDSKANGNGNDRPSKQCTFFRSGIYKNHEDEFFKKHPVKSTIRKANSWREKRLEKNLRRNEKPLSNTWKASTRELSLLLPPSEISPTSEALGTDHSWTKFFMEISQ